MFKIFLIIFYLNFLLTKSEAFWQKPHLPEFLQKFVIFPGKLNTVKKSIPLKELKDNCDEQEIVLQLSRLYVISPERIILLLTQDSIKETCQDIDDILQHINLTITESKPLPVDNLYMKLYSGLVYYNSYACLYNKNIKSQHLHNYHECLIELREDLLDCEGPPDWFEKSNETIVCQYFNDIINCNYIKTALLCGLKPARMLRSFSYKIMNKIVKFKCKISNSLPYIDDPMPSFSSSTNETEVLFKFLIFIIFANNFFMLF